VTSSTIEQLNSHACAPFLSVFFIGFLALAASTDVADASRKFVVAVKSQTKMSASQDITKINYQHLKKLLPL